MMNTPETDDLTGLDAEQERPLSDDDFEAVADSLPGLGAVRQLLDELYHYDWFGRCGAPFAREERDLAEAYLDALGFPDAALAPLTDFEEAADAAISLDIGGEGWEAEEQVRAALAVEAAEMLDEQALEIASLYVRARSAEVIAPGLVEMARRFGVHDDEELLNAAAGTAVQTIWSEALRQMIDAVVQDRSGAVLVAEPDGEELHPAQVRFQIFASGRWPVGIAGRSFNIL
ncbi:MAG: hypothetical protein ACPG06_03450 [Alphaproteobacteria bacterium]